MHKSNSIQFITQSKDTRVRSIIAQTNTWYGVQVSHMDVGYQKIIKTIINQSWNRYKICDIVTVCKKRIVKSDKYELDNLFKFVFMKYINFTHSFILDYIHECYQ